MKWRFLVYLLISHVFIDAAGSIINPLLKRLGAHHTASDFVMGIVAAVLWASVSFSQILFGYLYDRFRMDWLMPLSVVLIGICLGLVGLTDSLALLILLVIVGGLSSGAFHPSSTAMAGSLSPTRRPLAIAVLVCAGALGVAAGPWFISRVVDAQGLTATAWLLLAVIPVAVVALLAFGAYRKLPHSTPTPRPPGTRLWKGIFSRSIITLFCVASFRSFAVVVCGTGMSFLIAEKTHDPSQALRNTGTALALLGLAMGFGGLLSGLFVRRESEKPGIIISLVLAAPLLIIFPLLSGPALLLTLVLGGAIMASTIPLVTATGQRLLPHSSAIASSLFMGLAWGTSGIAAPLAVTALGSRIGYSSAMSLLVAAGLLACILSALALPRIIRPEEDEKLAPSPTTA